MADEEMSGAGRPHPVPYQAWRTIDFGLAEQLLLRLLLGESGPGKWKKKCS